MSEPQKQTDSIQDQEQRNSVLFAQLLFQLSNTAMVLMGKVADEGGKTEKDLDAAQLFIDQIEMLEAKTRGNVSAEESSLLKQTLMTLRMTFVQTVEAAEKRSEKASAAAAPAGKPAQGSTPQAGEPLAAEEEHRKKFSKKY